MSPSWAPVVADLDPVQRLQSFTLGLFETSNVVYFLGLTGFFLCAATVLAAPSRRRLDVAGLAGGLGATIALIAVAGSGPLDVRMDATKSRRYSLSPRTTALLRQLDGDWTVAVLLVEQRADRALLRQVDEVLDRYAAVAPQLQVQRIDPTDPNSVLEFEALLASLINLFVLVLKADGSVSDTELQVVSRALREEHGEAVVKQLFWVSYKRTANIHCPLTQRIPTQ